MRGKVAEIFSENIEGDEREFEFIMLGLRKEEGVSLDDYSARFGGDFRKKYADKLKIVSKYVVIDNGRLKIRLEYMYVQNEIIINFMD